MKKPDTLISVMALPVLFTLAAHSAAKENSAPQAEEQAFVETSYLVAPRKIGDFVLEGARYDENQKYSGAGFRYMLDGHQETRIDVYVYPAGKMSRETAMTHGMQAFRADLARAVDAHTYTNLVVLDEREFVLADVPQPLDTKSPADRNVATILAATAAATHPTGRKIEMTMNLQPRDLAMRSSGHLFYKQLYYLKVRATAAQERISAEEFRELTDRAARTLVPAIEVVNIGSCANSTINLDINASPDEVAEALVTQASVHQGYNCHANASDAGIEKKSESAEVIDISYEPAEWKSE